MGRFPSGQRGQTVNLLAPPSKVRILVSPFFISKYCRRMRIHQLRFAGFHFLFFSHILNNFKAFFKTVGYDGLFYVKINLPFSLYIREECNTKSKLKAAGINDSRNDIERKLKTVKRLNNAVGQNRTVDTRIFSPLLYRLSYNGKNNG